MAKQKPVKCPKCGQSFYRDQEPFVFYKNRYWHESCYQQSQQEQQEKDKDLENLNTYICQLLNIEFVSPRIQRQIKSFVTEYNFTYTGIQKTLEYFFEIKKNSLAKSNGGIGIVPYVYNEARDYYEQIFRAQQINQQILQTNAAAGRELRENYVVRIKAPKTRRKKLIPLDISGLIERGI